MPTQRLSMRRIREVLRLRHQGLTERVIAQMLGVSNGVVHGYVRRARLAGLSWPLPEGMDDEGLELLLFPAPMAASQSDRRPTPDWAYVEKELRRRSVTRLLLWEEYRAANPGGFGYTWFCTTFEAWKQRARPSMRQTHIGGEKVFVDFAGDTIDIFDPITGEVRAMKLFVAAMGASNYTYAEACPSESLSDWIGVHANLFRYLGGVPKFVVCDNLKAAVTNPDRYDPGINRTYAEMAGHYGTAILAARPRRPKDKAKVEVAVQIAQRWILARLMPPSAASSSNSTPAKCGGSAPAAPNCSPRSIVPSWGSCRTSPMSLHAGSVAASLPTITSRSMVIGIPPLTA
jgi:transposase